MAESGLITDSFGSDCFHLWDTILTLCAMERRQSATPGLSTLAETIIMEILRFDREGGQSILRV